MSRVEMMSNMLETSFRKRTLENQAGWAFVGTLYKKKGNPSLYKLTSVIKEGKSPAAMWHERNFRISSDGVISYTKASTEKLHALELRDCFLRLSCPLMDHYGQYHVHLHSLDGAPTPYTFEIGARVGLDSSWSLCAHNETELMECLRAILSHMYPLSSPSVRSLATEIVSDPQLALPHLIGSDGDQHDGGRGPSPAVTLTRALESAGSTAFASSSRMHVASGGASQIQSLLSWVRLSEVFIAFVMLNILLALFRVAEPGSIEAWLFAGATNLLVCFALLVRLEQIMLTSDSPLMRRLGSSTLFLTAKNAHASGTRAHHGAQGDALNDSDDDDDEVNPGVVTIEPGAAAAVEAIILRPTSKKNVASSSLKNTPPVAISKGAELPRHSYSTVDATTLMVRCGPNYHREGRKAPSEPSLMALVGCDLYYSKEKIDLISEKVIFPEPSFTMATGRSPSPADPTGTCKPLPGGLPHFFVFNLQAQDQGPALFGSRNNSSGFSLVMYFEPSEEFIQEVAELMEDRPCSNAAALTYRWLTSFHKDVALKERLKLKATIVNEDPSEILGWVSRYNGKPAMVTKSNKMNRVQGRTQQGRACDVVECDVDLRVWNLLFRQGLSNVLPQASKLCFNIALVVEGETDNELPERVLGAAQFNHLELESVSNWS